MMKMRIVEMQPPPNFHAAAPARIVRKGPCMWFHSSRRPKCTRDSERLLQGKLCETGETPSREFVGDAHEPVGRTNRRPAFVGAEELEPAEPGARHARLQLLAR